MTDKVVEFPKTAAERNALRKVKQDQEKQKLISQFIDESGNGLFHTPDDVAYADLFIGGCRQTWPIRSNQFRFAYIRYLKTQIEQAADKGLLQAILLQASLSKRHVNAAIEEFELRAITSSTVREVHLRVASDSGDLYIDLCDPDWHAIRITGAGWQVVQSPPVRFRRTPGMLPLPLPERGTSISALRPFLNVKDDADFTLVVAYLLAALRDRGPYPILVLNGEQGSAKSTFARIIRSLTDPNVVALSTLPPSGRDLFIAANNARLLAFENISKLSPALSDNICRLSTGGGFRIRKLYANSDETLLTAVRPIVLDGISNFVTRGDLQDRAIVLPLAPISHRMTEGDLYAAFELIRPGIFGALLDLLVCGVRQLPETKLTNAPRLADFATWAVACGLDGFEAAYKANRTNAIAVMLEHDALAQALLALVQTEWQGTASELLDVLGPVTKIANAKSLSDEMRRITPMLRSVGLLDISHERTADRRAIRIKRRTLLKNVRHVRHDADDAHF
jgi:hypothetical protein